MNKLLVAAYSIVDRLSNRAHYAAIISLETRRVTAYVCNGTPALPGYLESDRWQAEALEQIAIFSGVVLPGPVLDLDAPDFDIETIGKVVGRQLHIELSRAGHNDHNKFCSTLLERPIISLALLTLEEACAVRDALTADENAYMEAYHVPAVTLTNPAHNPIQVQLDPNQSGVGARAQRYL